MLKYALKKPTAFSPSRFPSQKTSAVNNPIAALILSSSLSAFSLLLAKTKSATALPPVKNAINPVRSDRANEGVEGFTRIDINATINEIAPGIKNGNNLFPLLSILKRTALPKAIATETY